MNTNKWGPSGWNQLGPSSYRFDHITKNLKRHANTFNLIYKLHLSNTETQLPCKYCRESYTVYIKELRMDPFICKGLLNIWMYKIHNKVNDKLRKQGYNKKLNPSLEKATSEIKTKLDDYYKCTGWDYIYCIALNYPENLDLNIKHQLTAKLHFTTLPYILPHPELTAEMLNFLKANPVDNFLNNRTDLVSWVYNLHLALLPVYDRIQVKLNFDSSLHRKPFVEMCKFYETFRAGCGLSKGKTGPSCRLPFKKIKQINYQGIRAPGAIAAV
jgi:hypothetical protein